MATVTASKGSFSVKAYAGDNKTLLAFNLTPAAAKNLVGFTIACRPPATAGQAPASYYLFNELQFQTPGDHAQVSSEPANSTINAPIQKFRWTHVPGTNHQGLNPAVGDYVYTVTPRYVDAKQSMQPLDATLSVSVTVPVGPFQKDSLQLGFTRGYMQSEAFSHHFGLNAKLQPAGKTLLFDTTQQAGQNATGQTFTYQDEYAWMGSTARVQVFAVLNEALKDTNIQVDMFAYDLNEPDILNILLDLAAQGRIRIILDDASLHTNAAGTTPEDQFTKLFQQKQTGKSSIVRGAFGRFSHDKILILSRNGAAYKVLTGSTNFSVTGLYVNANHVLIFDDATVAGHYEQVFAESLTVLAGHPKPAASVAAAFAASDLATKPFTPSVPGVPPMTVTFSPHTDSDVTAVLNGISTRIQQEEGATKGSVLFAVMQLTGSASSVYSTLCAIHEQGNVFSYGISDAPSGTFLYKPGSPDGILVTGKPGKPTLPPPFDAVPSVPGHEIHDKFVVCGFNGSNPVVYCGSSNLASGGEALNGDNLLAIHDGDVATAFAIEALLLVDHYAFLDRYAAPKAASAKPAAGAAPKAAATKTAAKKSSAKAPAKKSASKKVRASVSHRVAPVQAALAAPKKAKKKSAQKAPTKVAAKKAPAKKAVAAKAPATKAVAKKAASSATPLVAKQPRSKQQAAAAAGMFLTPSDSWTAAYYTSGDLKNMERVLFG
jgi:hypothetical protein